MRISKQLLEEELVQRQQEGCDVSALIEPVAQASEDDQSLVASLYEKLAALEPCSNMSEQEPNDLDQIRALRTTGPRSYPGAISESRLYDSLLGAWLGRAAGCLLGKPCEGWSHSRIMSYLALAGLAPLDDYFPAILPMPPDGVDITRVPARWLRGHVRGAPRDDDTDYTILGLHILEEHGPQFTTADVGQEWLTHLPYLKTYTAERAAYANLVNGLQPPETATRLNPFREWIGAQIRADMWGYVAPGRPELAADLAWRDARLSHVKNGIYGEMWVAACLATAFVEKEPSKVLEIGLTEIPQQSRLAKALRDTISWATKTESWQDTRARVEASFGHYHPVHTINNACVVALALIHGEGDFERTISIAVMCGWDTDCNGATAGSIVGAILGARMLPDKWIAPLQDTVDSAVEGFDHSRISQLAERTLTQAQTVLAGS